MTRFGNFLSKGAIGGDHRCKPPLPRDHRQHQPMLFANRYGDCWQTTQRYIFLSPCRSDTRWGMKTTGAIIIMVTVGTAKTTGTWLLGP